MKSKLKCNYFIPKKIYKCKTQTVNLMFTLTANELKKHFNIKFQKKSKSQTETCFFLYY